MSMYDKSGPQITQLENQIDAASQSSMQRMQDRIEEQDRKIRALEQDVKKLRNDLRTAISAANVIASNRRRNG